MVRPRLTLCLGRPLPVPNHYVPLSCPDDHDDSFDLLIGLPKLPYSIDRGKPLNAVNLKLKPSQQRRFSRLIDIGSRSICA